MRRYLSKFENNPARLRRQCALSSARCRASGLLQLQGSAKHPILDRHHGQVSTLVSGLSRWIDDLTNGSHRIDDLRAGGVNRASSSIWPVPFDTEVSAST